MIVGISGKKGHGKDHIGNRLKIISGERFIVKKYASKLKERIAVTWNIEVEKLEDPIFKDELCPLGITWRQLMQKEGLAMREIDEDFWLKTLLWEYDKLTEEGKNPNWVITDVRFENEAKAIVDRGGLLIRVNRPSVKPKGEEDYHPSEVGLDFYKGFNLTINNDELDDEAIAKHLSPILRFL